MRILSTLDREVLKPNTSVALHRHSHSVVEILPPESDSTIQLMQERPDVTYHDIGGMDMQKQEVGLLQSAIVSLLSWRCWLYAFGGPRVVYMQGGRAGLSLLGRETPLLGKPANR